MIETKFVSIIITSCLYNSDKNLHQDPIAPRNRNVLKNADTANADQVISFILNK